MKKNPVAGWIVFVSCAFLAVCGFQLSILISFGLLIVAVLFCPIPQVDKVVRYYFPAAYIRRWVLVIAVLVTMLGLAIADRGGKFEADSAGTPVAVSQTQAPTDKPAPTEDAHPTPSPSPEPTEPPEPTATPEPTPEPTPQLNTYICNVNTHVFHVPTCSDVSRISSWNRSEETCYYDTLIAMGYKPCGHCHPR